MQEIILKIRYFKTGLSKAFKKLTLFLLLNPILLIDMIMWNKRDLELVTIRSSGYTISSENPFLSDALPDQVWWRNIKWFLSYSKNYIC